MNRLIAIGLILLTLGVLGLVFPRVTWTEERTALDLGPVEIEAEQERSVAIPDIASGAAIAVGALLAVVGASRGRRTP